MTDLIRSLDLTNNSVISLRDIQSDKWISSTDVNQVSGDFVITEPLDNDGTYGGRVVIYPASLEVEINEPIILTTFDRVGDLYYPLSAKFDYIRRKLWIADTGNDRVLKVNLNTYQVDIEIENIYYPHAIAINLNNGGVFVKGYSAKNTVDAVVIYFRSNGTELVRFGFDEKELDSSSSSSSFSGSLSSSSSSSIEARIPDLPPSNSLAFDHVCSRVWWVFGTKIYMADVENEQVQVYDLRSDNFRNTQSITVELSSGNAFVIVQNVHDEDYLIQMSKDNNELLGTAYLE